MQNKYTAINTLDYRLAKMGFLIVDSRRKEFENHCCKDTLIRKRIPDFDGMYWCLMSGNKMIDHHFSKRGMVQKMEDSGMYPRAGEQLWAKRS